MPNNPLKPSFLFIEITTECNLHCRQCHMWKSREDRSRALTTLEKSRLIDEFRTFCDHGTVVFTGGETTLKFDELISLSKRCRELGLKSAVNTNGTQLASSHKMEEMMRNGPDYIVVSLDSHDPEVHDRLRGVNGTWKTVTESLDRMVSFKARNSGICNEVVVSSIVMEWNYQDLPKIIEFCKTRGLDGIMFQMISRTFWNRDKEDPAFEELLPQDKTAFKECISDVISRYGSDPFIRTQRRDLEWMMMYVDNPDFTSQPVCASHERNMMVDVMGDVQLCFGMRGLMGGKALGNVRDSSLSNMWTSRMASEARAIMMDCRKNCGLLNCHRR